jgi:hypothetical protein
MTFLCSIGLQAPSAKGCPCPSLRWRRGNAPFMTSDAFPRALSARLYYIGTSFSSTADDKTMTRQQHSDERPIIVYLDRHSLPTLEFTTRQSWIPSYNMNYCVVHLQDKVTPSTKTLWPGASFQNRSYWDRSSLFWIREDTSADDEGIVAWRFISKQILLIP